ncbi:MAG: ATP-dependent DNA helicase RecG [Sphingobacteriaceae bacterium]
MLDTPIEYLKGIGPQRSDLLKTELGIFTFRDLLFHFPFRHVDRTKFHTIKSIFEESVPVQLRGTVEGMQMFGERQSKRLVVKFKDQSGFIDLVWFKGHQWMASKLQVGVEYIVYGKPTEFKGKFNIAHPEMELASEWDKSPPSSFQPVYNTTEKLKVWGMDTNAFRKMMKQLFLQIQPSHINENLTDEIRSDFKLIGRFAAMHQLHFPDSYKNLMAAELRLKFEELFYVQLRLLRLNKVRANTVKGFVFSKVGKLFNDFFNNYLPFELTQAQKRVIKEIRTDTGSGKQMNRLVQGDVGSGKTLVALMCMLLANDNGFQACMMAPTEILAQQHFATFMELLKDMPVKIALLTGSSTTKERRSILNGIANGEINLLIGTHALIEDKVVFQNLGFVVIDEQHRFGVEQRARLAKKNTQPPHILIMTATPIPRTLAMTLYGDLDTSVIDELPPGRKPIKTMHFSESQRLRLFGFMKEQVQLGRQVYVVYPLIKESEKMDYQNLQEGHDHLIAEFPPPQYQISIVHGKLTNEQKEFEMQRFVKGETQIMVATTVIEVGVNVPNASVMVIESAERFGLSQLHQLRGRVGRGAEQSYCILMTGYKLGQDSRTRMETMVRTNDGFEISEVDLKLRGPGDIEGTQQSGVLDLRLADLAKDGQILQMARNAAQQILEEDGELALPKNALYKHEIALKYKNRPDWSKVG